MIPDLEFKRLEAALWEYGSEVQTRYRAALASKGINASSKLSSTAQPVVQRKGDVFTLYMRLQDYWKYVEYGTRELAGRQMGKMAPLAPFVSWVRAKGIPLRGKKIEAVANAIRLKISRGLPPFDLPKRVVSGTIPKEVLQSATSDSDQATAQMERAAAEDIRIWTEEMMEELTR